MSTLIFLRRNIKWRLYHPFTILITILQPLLWLALYGSAAKAAVAGLGNVNYISYILPGLMVLVSFSACSSGGMKNYISKRDGSFYRILMAPVSRFSILLGQVLEAVLCAFLEAGILVIV